jgi:hypothetical protein
VLAVAVVLVDLPQVQEPVVGAMVPLTLEMETPEL